MRYQGGNPDAEIARIAARQHGVVSVQQLRKVGLDKFAVMRRARAGRLHPVHRGVYAVGYRGLSADEQWMAATLALGTGAVVSHRSAASLWGFLPAEPIRPIDISVTGGGGRQRRQGILLHRRTSLGIASVSRRRGIPVTTPAHTISDLRRSVPAGEHRRALRQAAVLGFSVADGSPPDGTRSELEFRFLELCRQNGIPMPAVNVRIGKLTVDFVWSDERLAVETDGYRYHRGRVAFEDDRARDLELRARGYDVIRLTYRQVMGAPGEVCAAVKRALRP
jgi:hypothetical protein